MVGADGLEYCGEVVRAVVRRLVVDLGDALRHYPCRIWLGWPSDAQIVVQENLTLLHAFVREDKWTKMLEGGHLDPFGGVLSELVEELDDLAFLDLIARDA